MRHPDDGELLSYIKNTLKKLQKRSEIEQHLSQCSSCQEHFYQFLQVETLLRSYGQSEVYPSIADNVLRHARQQEPTLFERIFGNASFRVISLPVAIVLGLLLLLLTFTVLASQNGSKWLPFSPNNRTQHIAGAPSLVVPSHASEPFISICEQHSQGNKGYIRICGYHYKSNMQFELLITVADAKPFISDPITTNANGFLQDTIYITSCKDVPSAIVVIDQQGQAEQSQILQYINFGSCPSASGVVGTPGQFEAWSIGPANTRKTA